MAAQEANGRPLPVLHADGSRLDWTQATYGPSVTFKKGSAVVDHHLSNAPELEDLIGNGVEFGTEVRCPRTLFSRTETSSEKRQSVVMPIDQRKDNLYVLPGVLTTSDVSLPTTGLHPLVHGGRGVIEIPAGYWLARGEEWTFPPSRASMLRFVKSPDGFLTAGMMRVEENAVADDPYFKVTLAADLYDNRLGDPDIQMAALIAAFGHLPRSSMASGGENEDCFMAVALRSMLDDHIPSVPDWDAEDYDPALAATVLEQFWVRIEKEDDE